MNPIQNFAFEEKLVRIVEIDGQPWFAGKDVCAALDIKDHKQALGTLDGDERRGYSIPPLGGIEIIVVSMPGTFRLIFRSRKPEAERFKRWLAHEVLPEIMRTGSYVGAAPQPEAYRFAPGDEEGMGISKLKVEFIREVRITYGRERARLVWSAIGLPPVPAALPDTEPEQCLDHLLEWRTEMGTVGELLRAALAGDEAAAAALLDAGLRCGEGCFTVANAHPAILRCYRGTRWRQPYRFLRRLEGAIEAKPMRYGRNIVARGVELPAFYADDETLH